MLLYCNFVHFVCFFRCLTATYETANLFAIIYIFLQIVICMFHIKGTPQQPFQLSDHVIVNQTCEYCVRVLCITDKGSMGNQ